MADVDVVARRMMQRWNVASHGCVTDCGGTHAGLMRNGRPSVRDGECQV